MEFKDGNLKPVKDGDALLFTLEDAMEPKGVNKFVTNVKLCFWSTNENRYIPLSDIHDNMMITEAEVIENQTCPLKND